MSTPPRPSALCSHLLAAQALTCMLILAAFTHDKAHAAALYANFDPTQTSPVDFSTTIYADASGYFSGCCVINNYGAGFTFTAEESGVPTTAWLALQPTVAGDGAPGSMERFFRFTIYDSATSLKVVAQGGTLGRNLPVTGTANVFEFDLGRGGNFTDINQRLTTSDSLVAGQSYFAFFYQAFGALSQTHWMASDTTGSSQVFCARNYDNNPCGGPGQPYFSQSPLTLLPTLALADGDGLPEAPPSPVPLPGTLPLFFAGLLGVGASSIARRKGASRG
jgi:hypothetical protein